MAEIELSLSKSTIRQQRLRLENIRALGGRCRSPECRWKSDDGKPGCNDERALQFDHKDGGGSAARRAGEHSGLKGLYFIKNHPEQFWLLCANCNSIKARNERFGALQHTQPARVRRSLGQPTRRVRWTEATRDRRDQISFEKAEREYLAKKHRERDTKPLMGQSTPESVRDRSAREEK